MIVIDAPQATDAGEQRERRQVLALLSTVHLIHEVDSLDEFRAWLDRNLQEMKEAGFEPYLQRVILIGPLDGAVCKAIARRMAPGGSFCVLPIPTTWGWLWAEREKLLAAARRVG